AESEQVDRRLDRRGEGGRPPVRREVDDLADEHAGQRRALEPAELPRAHRDGDGHQLISSPVSSTNTSSRFAGRRSPSSAKPLTEPSTPRIEILVPVRRVRRPAAPASASTSARRTGRPYTSTTSCPACSGTSSAGAP